MTQIYSKDYPFFASVKERYILNKPGSHKKTHHIILDLAQSGLTYSPGDSIGIFPHYRPELVQNTIIAMKANEGELVHNKTGSETFFLKDYLSSKANLSEISPRLLKAVTAKQTNNEKKQHLLNLQDPSNRDALKAYLGSHEVWDFLLAHEEVFLTPQELVDCLMPLLPRFYSIASSQKCVGNEVHLTVAALEFESNGHKRIGLCTHFLTELVEIHQPVVPIFIQPAHGFRLPENRETPIIMIGPGTGVAPFRAFLQERVSHSQVGNHWLFFGERNRQTDFFYEHEWDFMVKTGLLQLDVAFSRDQAHKIYVQHRLEERGEELYQWLQSGSYLYVCGDAQRMARDVDAALQSVVQKHGCKTPVEAKEYLKELRHQKRYQRDVY